MASPNTDAISARPRPIALLRSVAVHFRAYRRRLVVILVLATVGAVLEAAIVLLIAGLGSMLINGTQQVEKSMLGVNLVLGRGALCAIALSAVVARAAVDLALVSLKSSTDGRYDSDARSRLIAGFLDSDWDLQSEERAGGLQAALGTYVGQARTALQRLSDFAISLVSFVILLGASVLAGGWVAIVVVVVLGAVAAALRPLIEMNHRAATAYRDTVNGFSDQTEQIVRMAREVRIFAARRVVEEDADRESRKVGRSIAQMEIASGRLISLSTSTTYLAAVGGLIALIALGVDSPQPYVAMVLLLYRALIYGRTLQGCYQGLVASAPFVDALDERVARYDRAAEPEGTLAFDGPVDSIRFEDVSYAYPGGGPVLHGVSFGISRGEAVGIVGPSGSGKSTVIQLLLGFRHPMQGRISVNGSPPSAYTRSSWAERISLVPQEALLFDTTVAENVACFRPGIDTEDVRRAVASAHLLQEIEALPDGLDTQVGEGGRRLSGGQRQRLCLARALAGRPDVLVLDEPTSALDLISEEAIRETLLELKGKVTMVIIAHRMSTLRLCDRVLVVNGGRLEASGPREQLERGNEYYARAIKLAKLS